MDKKSQILEQTAQLIVDEGLGQLTLAKVAKKVGLTNAGLLYYFPNMTELKLAVIRWCDERYSRAYLEAIKNVDPYPGRTPAIYLETMALTYADSSNPADMAAGILYASGDTDLLISAYQNSYDRLKADCYADGGNVSEALSIIMAFEAMCFGVSMDLDENERRNIYSTLLDRAKNLR